ncbi:putative Germin-like protein 9-1 [Cocos nucifera]|uniref:Germin-like protein n=1 Tax=Cocos nucifera TaxID=13894 RepID=A0A8K0NA88_COCNU|nr:putative Germin-like protein 9-1 [Cocos nucifera]
MQSYNMLLGVSMQHTHPRSAYLVFVVGGWLVIVLIGSNNTLFAQVVRLFELDTCLFLLKGLVHFQLIKGAKYLANAMAAFGNANAGTMVMPVTLFGGGVD